MKRGSRGRRKVALVAALLAVLLAIPLVASAYYTSLLIVIAIYSILTVGLCMLMGYAGQVSLGHAAFYGIGAFCSAILTATYGVNPWLAMILAAALSGAVAFVMAFPIFRLRGNYLAMATLGFGIIVYILFVELKGLTGGPSGLPGVPPLSIGPLVLDSDLKFYYLAWAFCLGVLLVSQNVVNSRVGRALRAVHGSEAAALSLGIEVSRLKMKVFVLSAVYASLAGSLYAHYTSFVSPQPFGFMFSVRIVVMAVVGGLASIWGAVFGAATITILGDFLGGFGSMDTVVFGLILILVMVFMPQGLFRGVMDAYARGLGSGVRGKGTGVRLGLRKDPTPDPRSDAT